jgi:hypothetical protein
MEMFSTAMHVLRSPLFSLAVVRLVFNFKCGILQLLQHHCEQRCVLHASLQTNFTLNRPTDPFTPYNSDQQVQPEGTKASQDAHYACLIELTNDI